MNNQTLYRIGGAAAILGMLLLFAGYAVFLLSGIGVLLLAVYYFALYREHASGLKLAAVASTLIGGVMLLFIGFTPSVTYNIAMLLAFMLPPLLAGLAAREQADFPGMLAWAGIIGGALGILNAIINISGGGDWTNLGNPTLTTLSNLTYYPAFALVLVWLVWGGVRMFRKAS
jgi:hypothetical protein